MSEEKREKVALRVDLTGLVAERFLEIKKFYGLKSDAELVRVLISEEHRRRFP